MDALDTQIKIVKPRHYILLIAFSVLVVAFIIWSIFGTVSTRVEGQGLIMPESGQTFYAISEGDGLVIDLDVSPGKLVQKGEILAHITQSRLESEIEINLERLGDYLSQELELNKQIEEFQGLSEENITLSTEAAEKEKITTETYAKYLKNLLEDQRELLKNKYLAPQDYEKLKNQQQQLVSQAFNAEANISSSALQHARSWQTWYNQLVQLQSQITDLISTIDSQYQQYNRFSYVTSPVSGKVTQVLSSVGSYASPGKTMFVITKESSKLHVLTFFPSYQGKQVQQDMPANITLSTVKKAEYGTIQGQVTEISDYPLSFNAVTELVKNNELAKEVTQGMSVIYAVIALDQDHNSYSGFKWTSRKGPKVKVTSGTLAEVSVVVKKESPIELAFTFLRKWTSL